jgi:nucleoside-diphosphate-sugar epimerase
MVLITGATGLLGSHLLKQLANTNQPVKALYRTVIPQNFPVNVEWVKGDILDIVALEEAMKNVQQVYHCAGAVSFNPKKKEQLFTVNVEGTTNVVNACLNTGIEKLLFVSSVAALGRIDVSETINEETKWTEKNNSSLYGKTKYLAEMQVWRGIGEGLNAVIINPVIILGAGDWDKGSTEIFKTIYNGLNYYTEGTTGFADVLDVVRVMIELMNSDISKERFIVCGENISYKKIFYQIAATFGIRPPYKKITSLLGETVWRAAIIKSIFTGETPFITKETARAAQAKIIYDNSKLLKALPDFKYTPIEQTIERICNELKQKYNL